MNKIWIVRKYGKLKLVIAYYMLIFFLYISFFYKTYGNGGSFIQNILEFSFIYSIIIIIALIYPPRWIIKKRIATKIEFDFEKRKLKVDFDRKINKEFDFESLFYSIHKHKIYTTLVIYKKQLSEKSGNFYYAEIFVILGNMFNILWGFRDVYSIESELIRSNIDKYNANDESLIDCIM